MLNMGPLLSEAGVLAPKIVGAIGGFLTKHPIIASTGLGLVAGEVGNLIGGRKTTVKHKRRKGLTYNEIRGAVKLLKLVKRFAPAGHHMVMRKR